MSDARTISGASPPPGALADLSDRAASGPSTDGLEQRVLVAAPFGCDARALCQVLATAGLQVEECPGMDELCAEIRRGAAAAVVAEEVLSDEARRAISETLADEPVWSDLPLLVMTSQTRPDGHGSQLLQDLEETTRLVVLDRPLHTATLVSAVRMAVDLRRRQYQVRDELAARQGMERSLCEFNDSLERLVAERTAVAERRARDLQRLAAELTGAEHRERQRLAALLHDDLQQLLLAAKLRLPILVEVPHDEIEPHVEKIDQLLAECLSTSRNLSHELSPPVLRIGTLTEVMQWLGEWFGDKHTLAVSVDAAARLPLVPEHHRIFFFQAVRELLLNALKHSGSKEARIGLSFQDDWFVVQVEDGGTGFDPQAVANGLQRTEGPEGLGLFQIQQRLESQGGRLEILSGKGGGACFRMAVPLADDAPSRNVPTEASAAKRRAKQVPKPESDDGNIRLLVVDDHPVVREGLAELLDQQEGLVVVGQAGDGAQAIEQAERLCPDAIIMDIEMPNMDGIEATRQITQRHEDILIVGLTLHQGVPACRAMVEAGAASCISKRASAKEMIDAIRRACGHDPGSA